MIRLHKYIFLYLSLLMVPVLAGCRNSDNESPDFKVPEGMTQLTLLLPDYQTGAAQFGTRAFDPLEEGYMSNLYVIAIKYADLDDDGNVIKEYQMNEGVVYTYALNPVGEKFKYGQNDYHIFNVALYPGKYKFAVLANVDLYLWRAKKISDFRLEQDLRDIVLYFSEDTPLVPYHLPMVCLPEEIKYSVENDSGEYPEAKLVDQNTPLVTLEKGKSTHIFADMNFLCAKVRYTILFDKTPNGISEAFGNSWIRFNVDDRLKPIATNIRSWTKILDPATKGDKVLIENDFILSSDISSADDEEKTDGATGASYSANRGWWNMSIDRYKWSEEGENYPKGPKSELTPWDGSLDDWIESKQKVWQGIVYLPENLYNGKSKTTRLEFPYHTRLNSLEETPEVLADNPKVIYLFGNDVESKFEGLNGEDYSDAQGSYIGLDRDYFYDVVAKVTNPDGNMAVQVFVSIIPWHETDQNITESKPGSRPPQTSIEDVVHDWTENNENNESTDF
ncbi:MAG: hypothetical protein J1F38_05520 [Muribaculaceae bacterium]|nr:hypothetical protein [Muribaculaceae bacterium]